MGDGWKCPSCGSIDVEEREDRGGFLEIGEWNGKTYDDEFNVDGYRCRVCDQEFWVQ